MERQSKEYDTCHVCGGEAEVIKTRVKFYVRCSECGDRVRTGYYASPKEAKKAWKRRLIKKC